MTFNIATTDGIHQVKGEPITIKGRKCFVHEQNGFWSVNDYKSGMRLAHSEDAFLHKEEAITISILLLALHESHLIEKKALSSLKFYGYSYPVNK
jgi:hypothetical protein